MAAETIAAGAFWLISTFVSIDGKFSQQSEMKPSIVECEHAGDKLEENEKILINAGEKVTQHLQNWKCVSNAVGK